MCATGNDPEVGGTGGCDEIRMVDRVFLSTTHLCVVYVRRGVSPGVSAWCPQCFSAPDGRTRKKSKSAECRLGNHPSTHIQSIPCGEGLLSQQSPDHLSTSPTVIISELPPVCIVSPAFIRSAGSVYGNRVKMTHADARRVRHEHGQLGAGLVCASVKVHRPLAFCLSL